MKKLLIIIFCLLITGCTAQKPVITNDNLNVEETPSEVFEFALSQLSEDEFYYIGSGITVTEISDEGKVVSSDLALYPVYAEEEMCAMVLRDSEQDLVFISDLNVYDRLIKNGLVIVNNGNAYLISEGGETMPVRKKADSFDKKILEKIELQRNNSNAFGDERRLLKSGSTVTDPETGRKYSSSRLVVKFTEGDTDKKIADFEEFCGGKLRSKIKSIGIYVFEIEASDYTRLNYLVNQIKRLEYVEDVHLDEQNDPNSASVTGTVDK